MNGTEYIPREHFNLWYGMFKVSGGRLVGDPLELGERVFVSYSFDDVMDCNRLNESFARSIKPITETKRGFWKRLKIKLGIKVIK